ncbi:MAG: CDP-alcohol phosphatidyltransferase family protein [Longimicrobiales bacterium]
MTTELTVFLSALALALGSMPVYAFSGARNRPDLLRSEAHGSFILGSFLTDWFHWFVRPLERASLASGLSPTFFNLLGVFFGVAAGLAFAAGQLALGGWGVFLGGVADVMDGRIARARGLADARGAFLDSTLDRFAEFGVFVGLAVLFRSSALAITFVVLSLGGSMLVSYTRARGETQGVICKSGLMQRAERLVALGFGGLLDPVVSGVWGDGRVGTLLVPVLGLVAVGTVGTAVYRTAWIAKQLKGL